jgi:hypothetical protein
MIAYTQTVVVAVVRVSRRDVGGSMTKKMRRRITRVSDRVLKTTDAGVETYEVHDTKALDAAGLIEGVAVVEKTVSEMAEDAEAKREATRAAIRADQKRMADSEFGSAARQVKYMPRGRVMTKHARRAITTPVVETKVARLVSLKFTTNEDTNTRLIAEHMKTAHNVESAIADNFTTFTAHLLAHSGDTRSASKASHVHDDKAASGHETKTGRLGDRHTQERAATARVHALRTGEELPSDLARRKSKKKRTILDGINARTGKAAMTAEENRVVVESIVTTYGVMATLFEKKGELVLAEKMRGLHGAAVKAQSKLFDTKDASAPVVLESLEDFVRASDARLAAIPKVKSVEEIIAMKLAPLAVRDEKTARVLAVMAEPEGLMSHGVSLEEAERLVEKSAKPATSTRKYRH